MMLKQTKIVASISDLHCDVDFIRELFEAGMNVVRMNTAHASREGFEKLIANVREVSNRIAILMDTKGPEIRTTSLVNKEPIPYNIGDKVKVVGNPDLETCRECIAVSYPNFVNDLKLDGTILIDDGDLELRVIEKHDDHLLCEVQNVATLGNRKSVNVPGVCINLPSLTEKDRNNILFAIESDIDFIAHSFVRNKQDVLDIREILDNYGSDIRIIAKIENLEGVKNIDAIIDAADGIMVARGDLGVEIPAEDVPFLQKEIISKCNRAGKLVIVATQMLESMTNNPRPTRAEVSDVANAVFDGTDAIMLSGETASGDYPVEAVQTMSKIAMKTESTIHYQKRFAHTGVEEQKHITDAIAHSSVQLSYELGAKAILTPTHSGYTAKAVSKYRPLADIVAYATTAKVARQLNLYWGVQLINGRIWDDEHDSAAAAVAAALREGYVEIGDTTVITSGISSGEAGFKSKGNNTTKIQIAVVD